MEELVETPNRGCMTYIHRGSFYLKKNWGFILSFSVTYVTYVFVYLLRKLPSVTKPFILEDQGAGVDVEGLGYIDSAFFFSYTIFQVFGGTLADIYGPTIVVVIALVVSGVCAGLFAHGTSLLTYVLPWAVEGVGHAPIFSALLLAIISGLPEGKKGTFMSIFCTSQQLGSVLSGLFGTYICDNYGWRNAFLFLGALNLAWAPVAWVALVSPKSTDTDPRELHHQATTPKVRPSFVRQFLFALTVPGLKRAGFCYFFVKSARYTLLSWVPTMVKDVTGVDSSVAGYVSIFGDIAGTVGALITGPLLDCLNNHFALGRWILLACILGFAGLYQAIGMPDPTLSIVGLAISVSSFLVSMADSLYGAMAPVYIIDLFKKNNAQSTDISGTALAVVNGVGSLGGLVQGLVVPKLLLYFDRDWSVVAIFLAICCVLCIALNQELEKMSLTGQVPIDRE